ncbi:hypothetical protein EC9_21680 [Rosistilla ulvae]|uniref:DUF58 domain-containing protein n=1 Tax=Rosistilla ulvae TaxID=1930277 RepID=A0A517LZC6_9BACT|nr:DUF58 domain-containing protein [Rosistilla ulvae]QDS87983.1 hypothetical protein EC9_21680 [Rosistilla ulvae]
MPDSKRFLRPEAARRVARLELKARRVVEGFLSGMHRSPYFGQSIEFLQHRQYVAGDDIRHIDWKVWGRQDRLHIKQYEEETNFRMHLLVDSSASMNYGSGEENKFEYASSIASCLAFLANRQQDATGLITFDDKIRRNLAPRTSRYQLARILDALDGASQNSATDLFAIVREVAESVPRRGVIVLISDLLGVGESLVKALSLLRKRGHDVIVFQTLHDEEIEFPFSGATRFEGLESEQFLNCNPRALREGYLEALNAFLENTRRTCARLSIEYELVRTNQPLDAVLAKFLSARSNMPTLKG